MLKRFYWALIKLFRIHKIKLFFGHKGVVFKRLTRFQKPRKNSLECLNIFIFIYLPILPIFLLCPIPHLYFISFLFRTKIKFHKSLTINLLTTVRNPLIKVSRVSNWIIYQSISQFFLQETRSFGGVLPRGHGNDGLLEDLKRLLDEAEDLEQDFDRVIRPSAGRRPQPLLARRPPQAVRVIQIFDKWPK